MAVENGLINAKMNAETGSNIISPVIRNSMVNCMPITIHVGNSSNSDQKDWTLKLKEKMQSKSHALDQAASVEIEKELHEQLKIQHKKFFEKLEIITDYTSIAREHIYLHQIFTELWITDDEFNKLYKEHEVIEIESSSSTSGKPYLNSMKCTDIFRPIEGQRQLRVAITKGIAGIGKTTYVKKFLLDWAMMKAHQEYDFVFAFQFCELNLMSEERLSLLQLVQQHYPHMKQLSETYLENSARCLFIFDGLDERRFPLEFEKTPVCSDVTKLLPLQSLLINLIKGNLLPSASIWITTRPSAMNQIPSSCIHRVTEIQGFQDKEKEEYFMRKCQDEHLTNKIIALIKKKTNLWVMCYVPAFCWILATVLEHIFKSYCAEEFRMDTITEIYTNFIVVMVTYHHQHRGHGKEKTEKTLQLLQSDRVALLNLGKLAFQYLKSQTFVFYEEDLKSFNVDTSSIFGVFCKEYYIEYTVLSHKRAYSFVHATVQEYFAALYIFVSYHNEKCNLMSYSILDWFWKIFTKPTLFQVCKSACNEVAHSQTGHLDFFLQFLCGLGKKKIQKCLQGLLTHMQEWEDDLQKTSNYIKDLLHQDIHPERCINLFHCLNELNDKSVMREIITSIQHGVLSSKKLSLADYSALAFVLKTTDIDKEEFDLSKYRTSPGGLRRLSPVVKYFQKIMLRGSVMDEKMISAIGALLLSDKNEIKELCLINNTLQDLGLKKLSAVLVNSRCRLETLILRRNDLTYQCSEDLVLILRTNRILKKLDLKYNQLKDTGVKQLSDALKDSDCEIETLGLWGNSFTHCCCEKLALALKINQSLRNLDLGDNAIGDRGLKLLCHAIKDDGCKLEKLELHRTGLTENCCEELVLILRTSERLKTLELGYNNLGDVGVQRLSEALKDPNCKLQRLGLYRNNLTKACCPDLASGLKASSTLTELNLTGNNLQDSGVRLLFSTLKDAQCPMQVISLKGNGLTAACCEDILSALRVNRTLRVLNLQLNNLGSAIKLQHIAQQSNCQINLE
ncbi:NLR family CARD domain-containing protein 3-like isoform X2 [Hypanus sabinus]|uniref:NLR family CARD domain-containing protein 3-like isoform X2 n=1 Tax=Hypanus sabinus TaxID=79690 RepID=UPI0028C4695A|nr:NLR family CARD domain-containing protein 3-like isoform X2 [Hypanus sabinus]